jgi:hypothetical protein
MSFLDDLKKQAEEVKAQKAAATDTSEQRNERALASVRPRLQALYNYLKDACEQLTIVDPDVHVSYDVRGFGKLGPLRQSGYKVSSENPRKADRFTLNFVCKQPERIKFQVEGKERATQQKEFLWSCNLRFTSKVTADGSGVFFMDAYIPVSFEFEANQDTARINMCMRNVESLGSSRVAFEPGQIDENFMNELGKLMVRESNQFQELIGNTVSEETKMRLRQQIAHDQYMRQVEAASGGGKLGAADADKAGAAASKAKKKSLLKSLFGRS